MKIRTLSTIAIVAMLAASSASAHKLDVKNNSSKAVAIGGDLSIGGAWGQAGATGLLTGMGGRALAGSVYVSSACECDFDKVTLNNTSVRALAVGSAISGSIVQK